MPVLLSRCHLPDATARRMQFAAVIIVPACADMSIHVEPRRHAAPPMPPDAADRWRATFTRPATSIPRHETPRQPLRHIAERLCFTPLAPPALAFVRPPPAARHALMPSYAFAAFLYFSFDISCRVFAFATPHHAAAAARERARHAHPERHFCHRPPLDFRCHVAKAFMFMPPLSLLRFSRRCFLMATAVRTCRSASPLSPRRAAALSLTRYECAYVMRRVRGAAASHGPCLRTMPAQSAVSSLIPNFFFFFFFFLE